MSQLAYVLVTPHSLSKSRTGGILARLITRTGLELVAARMFGPSAELVREYAAGIVSKADPQDPRVQELIRNYVLKHFAPDPSTGRRRRVLLLVFKGEDAVRKISSVVGTFSFERHGGETIRDTFGELVADEKGQVQYFEPSVLVASSVEEASQNLKLWVKYSESDGGLIENASAFPPGVATERTLVLIKPDNFRFPTGRPGNVIDFFSRTGLSIVAIKVHRMSVAEAMEFYGPVRDVLRAKLKDVMASKTKAMVEKEMGFTIPAEETKKLGDILGPLFGEQQFENIVAFMSGRAPSACSPAELTQPGTEKCIALIYEGPDAVNKIRDVLGPTDPSKAPPGSIRKEFGLNIMVNAAHASDSPDSFKRENGIVQVQRNDLRSAIESFYAGHA